MKIVIVIDNLNTGGIATSLYNFLNTIKKYEIECDLLVFDEKSIDRGRIDGNINIIKSTKRLSILGITQKEVLNESWCLGIYRALLVGISRYISGNFARKILFLGMQKIKGYDLAVAYCHDLSWNSFSPGCRQYVQSMVNAKEKAIYVHCDFQNYGGYSKKQEVDYNSFDKILCVSQGCKKSFLNCFPSLKDRTYVQENFINENDILSKSEPAILYDASKTVFISVCRLNEEKGILRCLKAMKRIKDEGLNGFLWVIVGAGEEESLIRKTIIEYNLADNIELIGQKNNPYPFLKNANFMLLPSKHEAAPMVYGEASTLRVTTITTRTSSADELVRDRGIGWVCDNTENGIFELLKSVMENPTLYNCFTNKEREYQINSEAEKQLNTLF